MDALALISILICVLLNRPSRQWIGLVILFVFSSHYLLTEWMLSSKAFYSFMYSTYHGIWQWPYYLSAAAFDVALFAILLTCFEKSSLRRDVFLIIIGIVAVDLVGFIAYINYFSGDYYAGAMAVMNTILVLRLLILTRRDKDGLFLYRLSGLAFRFSNTKDVLSDSKGAQRG